MSGVGGHAAYRVRKATVGDHEDLVALAGAALGWRPGEPHEALFAWKHLANPFGPSPLWVAVDDSGIVAWRALLRWEFEAPGRPVQRAVRAVDTATHPDHQGRGLFRRLTLQAVEELTAAGVDFVFNTPNAQSRPGYLSMGWQDVGRVPVAVSVRGPGSSVRMLRSRVPAGKWSLETAVGEDAGAVLADTPALDALLAAQPPAEGLRTARSVAFLRWRYAEGPLAYRALLRTSRVEDGVALFRLRARGRATEATLCDVLVPDDDPRARRELVRALLARARPDYVIAGVAGTARPRPWRDGLVPAPGLGPQLTWRALAREDCPPIPAWDLRLGDIELF